uniref:Uncharacterized protein n=1 Tax=Glossina austeni TaxID=7395 RepID=A0A1A9V7J6_GLOAU
MDMANYPTRIHQYKEADSEMAGYRSLPLTPVSATALATVAAQPSGPTMYHQSMTAMSNNGIIYQSAVHASIHSLNTVQSQRSTTHHILAAATATAAAAVATAATRQFATTNGPSTHIQQHQHHQHPAHLASQQQQQQPLMGAAHHHTHHTHPQAHHHSHHHPHHQQMALHQNHLFFNGPTLGGHAHAHAHHRQLFSHMQNALMPMNVKNYSEDLLLEFTQYFKISCEACQPKWLLAYLSIDDRIPYTGLVA